MKDVFDLLGRILLSFIFLWEGYDSIAYYQTTLHLMEDYGLTWQTQSLLNASIFLLVMGGLMILIGYRPKLGAVLLLMYWLPVTFIIHPFWTMPEEFRRADSVDFMKNLTIAGGLLMVLVNGAGRFSIRKLLASTRV